MSREIRRQLPDRAARRAHVLQALAMAAEELSDDFVELSVETLARRAGISRASFYLYFEDKSQLVRSWYTELDDQVNSIYAAWWSSIRPTRDSLFRVLADVAALHRDSKTIMSAVQGMSAHSAHLRNYRAERFESKRQMLCKHIQTGQEEGWVNSTLAADATAAWSVSMLDRVMQRVVPSIEDPTSFLTTGAEIIWRTLYAAQSHDLDDNSYDSSHGAPGLQQNHPTQ